MQIRRATENDAEALLKIYAPYVEHTAITFEYEVPSVEEFRSRIRHTLEKYPYLVDELRKHKGIGGKLHDALEQALKTQGILNMNACIAWPDGEEDETLTKNSGEFHAHLGYRMVGEFQKCGYKFHRWYNMVWMEKIIGEHADEQPSPIPFSQLEDIHF